MNERCEGSHFIDAQLKYRLNCSLQCGNGMEVTRQFDFDTYYASLKTKNLGHIFLWFPLLDSTFHLLESFKEIVPGGIDFAILSYCCSNSVGRTGSKWISPEGSLSFTLSHYLTSPVDGQSFPIDSTKLACWLQHLTAIALVETLRERTFKREGNVLEYNKNVDFHIKWPNDVYYAGKYKIAGILIRVNHIDDRIIDYTLSFGLNYYNTNPILGLLDISKIMGGTILVSPELFLASFLNRYENYTETLLSSSSVRLCGNIGDPVFCDYIDDVVKKEYYGYWLTKIGQNITIHGQETRNAIITGLDDYGYLRVMIHRDNETEGSEMVTLHDQEYSFDVVNHVLFPK
ncbi:unnamed protein product [Gordionus sp. m RMFG-2023]